MMGAQNLGALFQASVARHANREAIVYRDARWTYGDLGDRVAAAQRILTTVAGRKPKRVGIVGANHPAYVVAYFAAQTLGATTIEVGRDETLVGLRHGLTATDVDVFVTDRSDLLDAAPAPAIAFQEFLLACETELMRSAAPLAGEPSTTPDDLVSIVYTSGTTGSPKGVMLSHGGVMFVINAVREYLAITPDDRYALVLPLSHTYGKSNLLTTITSGAAVVFVENPQRPEAFFGQIMQERCTILSVVPFHLNVLARRGLPAGVTLDTVRAITTSGGPLPEGTARSIGTLIPQAELFSMYGLTESSTRVTYLPPAWLPNKPGSVGRPLPGMRLEIRSDDGRVLNAGEVGHVFVTGPNVMRGYYGEPGLTAETLIDGWLRTGDVGYVDIDHCLFITGREKEIIKVAGERISPVEIEEVLLDHPAVVEAAVKGVPDSLLGETVWAYVILNPPGSDTADIAAFCAARLSPHKIPRRFIEVERIPRTPTGKIRRHLLVSA